MKAIVVNSGVPILVQGLKVWRMLTLCRSGPLKRLGVEPDLVGVASTGIIGELLPLGYLENGLSKLVVNGNAEILPSDFDDRYSD